MDYNFPIISVKYGRKKGNKKRYTTTSYQETQIKTTTRCPPERLNLKKKNAENISVDKEEQLEITHYSKRTLEQSLRKTIR